MYNQAAYLYRNVQTVYTDLVTNLTGFRKMYNRTLNLYKGIDNTFSIKLLNGDQKLLNAVGQTLVWTLLDKDTAELKLQSSVVVDGSYNSLVPITVNEGDLEAVNSGKYIYSTYLVDQNNKKTILYGDSQYGASVPVEVISNSFPQAYPSQEVDSKDFINSGYIGSNGYIGSLGPNSYYTSALPCRPELNNHNNALHTAAFYTTNYSGTISVEATLENGVTDVIQWAIIDEITIDPSDTLTYLNFNGIYTFVRFGMNATNTNTGRVDKILYRS
jgi:hypothetical protein